MSTTAEETGSEEEQKVEEPAAKEEPLAAEPKKTPKPIKPDVATALAGESKDFVKDLKPYLPQDLVGGAVPHVPGMEEEAVWNAASQACGTEKVNYCYSIAEGKIWYLACPSSSLSSNPDTWCPLAAALPGNSEFWDKETVYLFEHEGIASALRWDPDTGRMQVFLGASRTILPRIQSMDANFVTINADEADIVPWRNKMLRIEKMSRATLRVFGYTGLLVVVTSIVLILFSFMTTNMLNRDLTDVKFKTDQAATSLMRNATNVMQSDAIKHMVRVQELLDGLSRVNGTLVKYEIKKGKVLWEALVPPAFAERFGTPQGLGEDGRARVRGNR